MEKHIRSQKQNNADKLEDISISVKSLQRQTSEIRSDLAYIKAYLDIKAKQKEATDKEDTTTGGSWWWG
tara:strand:- start:277 stop:483 length:207 start_codon:yes stop_codon:yes gene_type:complete